MRLDQYLVNHHYFESRNKASAAVKEGTFAVNEKQVFKPAYDVSEGDRVTILKDKKTFVARSAHKLLRAYKLFELNWEGKVAADLGASTGGFCQVMLEKGLKRIYAVDIGTAQLHISLKNDPRIINMEHTNARYITADSFAESIDVITADLSFISIKAILPAIYQTLCPSGQAVLLIKPQFEAGPQHLSKSGVVTDKKVRCRVIEDVAQYAEQCGFGAKGIAFSGLPGESGNIEYLLFVEKDSATTISISSAAYAAVYTEENYD
ncbi:MAG: TlyA family RNA methyltransferase [Clostridia bacterium]|nr:TlyA family RNA methyltransferase [Clostridia bacterium]